MNNEYDVVVVGGGLAGLTCAAYLCRYGYRILLCEKSSKTGGLVNTFWHKGYAFDAGIRAFENSGILFPMLKSLGIDIDFTTNNVFIGIEDKRVELKSRESLQGYADVLKDIFQENTDDIIQIEQEIKKVMDYMDVIYGIDNPLFMEDMGDKKYLIKTLLPWLLKYKINIRRASRLAEPVVSYLKLFTASQALIDMITQHFFKNTPAFFALSYFRLYLDYCYPMGGTGVLSRKVTDYIRSTGGRIMTQAEVSMLDAGRKQVNIAGVKTFRYKKLVWASDQKTLYASLSGQDSHYIGRQRALVEQGIGGDSVLTLFMGVDLDRGFFQNRCSAHAFYTPSARGLSSIKHWDEGSHKEGGLYDWIGKYLELTTYEISCPALRDGSLAPEGKTGVIVSTLMDYRLVRYISDKGGYEAFKDFCIRKIIEVLEKTVFPRIGGNVEFSLCTTPLTIEQETGNAQGAITGWSFTNAKLPSENRFKKMANSIKTPIKDVFQCGQWTFSPSGLPVSILTGKLAADAIRKSL